MKIDVIDRCLLDQLQRNGRLTNLELADRAGISPSPCLRRVRQLEEDGLIVGYGAKLDRHKLGLGVTAFVSVNMERHQKQDMTALRRLVAETPEVISCHLTSGEYDFMFQVVVPDLEAYRVFVLEKLLRMPGVKNSRTSFVVDTVKEFTPLPLQHLE